MLQLNDQISMTYDHLIKLSYAIGGPLYCGEDSNEETARAVG